MAAEEIQQYGDSLFAWDRPRHDCFQTLQGPPGNPNPVAGLKFLGDHAHLVIAETGAQFLDYWAGDRGPAIPEMHDLANSPSVLDPAQMTSEIESSEQVVGEERLGNPHGAELGRALKADAREEDLDRQHLPQLTGRDMLLLQLRPNTEPALEAEIAGLTAISARARLSLIKILVRNHALNHAKKSQVQTAGFSKPDLTLAKSDMVARKLPRS